MTHLTAFLLALAGAPRIQEARVPERPPEGIGEKAGERWPVLIRVVEAETGRPLEGVRGTVLYRKVPYAWMIANWTQWTNAEGMFGALLSFPDTHVLYATDVEMPNARLRDGRKTQPRFGQAYRPIAVTSPEGQTTQGSVELGPPALLRLTVTDEKGGPVSGASVVAVSEDAPHPVQFLDSVKTDETGGLEFVGLGEGSWRLLLCKRGIGVASVELPNLKWGEKRDLAAKLGPSGDLYVRCLLRRGGIDRNPPGLSALMWEVYDGGGKLVSAGPVSPQLWGFKSMDELPTSKEDESFVYAGSYAPGRYRVLARSPRPSPRTTTEFVRDCIESTVEVVIEPGKEARVLLTLPLPAPAPR